MIRWHTEKKIRWHMGFMPFAKFCISRLIKKIYRDGYHDGIAIATSKINSMTASQWMTSLRRVKHSTKIDNEGRKILFIESIE